MQFSNREVQLFNEAGICIENKDYSKEEVEKLKIRVADYIMSQSTKEMEKYNKKFNNIL